MTRIDMRGSLLYWCKTLAPKDEYRPYDIKKSHRRVKLSSVLIKYNYMLNTPEEKLMFPLPTPGYFLWSYLIQSSPDELVEPSEYLVVPFQTATKVSTHLPHPADKPQYAPIPSIHHLMVLIRENNKAARDAQSTQALDQYNSSAAREEERTAAVHGTQRSHLPRGVCSPYYYGSSTAG
jgi:hypothetical protein